LPVKQAVQNQAPDACLGGGDHRAIARSELPHSAASPARDVLARPIARCVVRRHLVDDVSEAKSLADRGSPVLDQLTFADFPGRGEFDRHLRRMRPLYRRRRDTLIQALRELLPDIEPAGIAAGLHLVGYLPSDLDERRVINAAARRGIAVY
jgi:DNA-binding transcriptional MocR family regulator